MTGATSHEDTPPRRTTRARLSRVAVLGLACAVSLGMEFPENIGPIEIRDVMWQALPDQVRAVRLLWGRAQ